MVTQFNPRNPKIGSLIKDNWNIMQNTEELTQILKYKPLIGYRRLLNLKDLLSSSSITYPPTPKPLVPTNQYIPIPKSGHLNKIRVSTLRKHLNVNHSPKTKDHL